MSLESALRTKLLANTSITAILGSRIFVGDTPSRFVYPFIRIGDAGENPDDYRLAKRMIKTITIDIFAEHNSDLKKYGYTTLDNLSFLIRDMFDAFRPERWTDSEHIYDVQDAEYRGFSTRKSDVVYDVQKPITLTITYNIIS